MLRVAARPGQIVNAASVKNYVWVGLAPGGGSVKWAKEKQISWLQNKYQINYFSDSKFMIVYDNFCSTSIFIFNI